jgi:hypothetical protein
MMRAAIKAERKKIAQEKVGRIQAFFILIDLWDETAEKVLFFAAAYLYKMIRAPETNLPETLGEFLLEYDVPLDLENYL